MTKTTTRLLEVFRRHVAWPLCTLAYVFYDTWNYARHSGMIFISCSSTQLDSRILASCHVLEKGLSFPEPKRPYGEPLAKFICDSLNKPKQEPSPNVAAIARGVLTAYKEHHDALDYKLGSLTDDINIAVASGSSAPAGIRQLSFKDFTTKGKDLATIIRMRKSVRDFAGPPQPKQIERAVELALQSPSACNRQSWRVYWSYDNHCCSAIAKMHTGSRGFGHDIPSWMVITVDVAAFQGPRERWATYVDGGMFAMSILLALTEVGLASCPLNWSTSPLIDRRIHKLLKIPSSEVIVMLVAIGTPHEICSVPISSRRPVSDILRIR